MMVGDMSAAMLRLARSARITALAIAVVLVASSALATGDARGEAVGVKTRFDYVAVFPPAVAQEQIEDWRQHVLGQPQQQACMGGRPCIARMIRLALAGLVGREVIAFDLMPNVSPVERAAIVAAALAELPGTALHVGVRPADLASSTESIDP